MKTLRQIMITHTDRQRLGTLLEQLQRAGYGDRGRIDDLMYELERAEPVDSHEVLADVITMNSTVRLRDLDTDETFEYTLVYPEDADTDQDKVSVLAPVGTAMIGYRVGDEIEWPVPAGTIHLRVEEVTYQPERAGEDR
jgi:regulator of nucleoside diphosphate kinase